MSTNVLKGLAALALLAIIIFFAYRSQRIYVDKSFMKAYIHAADSLNKVVSRARDSIKASLIREAQYEQRIIALKAQKDSVDTKIAEVRAVNKQKVQQIAQAGSTELHSFFIERYHADLCPPTDTLLRHIATDLINGDDCAHELSLANYNLNNEQQQIAQKDGIIGEKNRQLSARDSIELALTGKYNLEYEQAQYLTKRYRHLRRNDRIKTIVGFTGTVVLGALLIKKELKN